MTNTKIRLSTSPQDMIAGLVVFLVALPLCLGVALASNAPLISGLIAGIIGGIVVGFCSKSQTSVSGPAAGLTAVVAAQITSLGSFQVFLLALVIGGLIQIGLGIAKAGFMAAYFPSSVIKGLLAAIGVILILKQIPHVLGHDSDPEGEMQFWQPDQENTLTELLKMLGDIHVGAAAIGIFSIVLLVVWDRIPTLKKQLIPAHLVVVLFGVGLCQLFRYLGGNWSVESSHLVQVPVSKDWSELSGFLVLPDFTQWANPAVYVAGVTIALVASLETLLNLKAVDKLDPRRRTSPPSRELVAQGIGNLISGMIGGIPITSVIVRSSVNIDANARTKLATIVHGILLLVCFIFLPTWLNSIPLSCLAAILLMTGLKLASPKLLKQMWKEGPHQFAPFVITVLCIVFTDLLIGIGMGLAISLAFILRSNLQRPQKCVLEKHLGGDVLHVELANQVSFLNQPALEKVFDSIPRGGHLLLDAQNTVYLDPDILSMIRDFKERDAPIRGVQVSLRGFREKYDLQDEIQFVDYSTRELQELLTPTQVLQILKEGNERFRTGRRLTRDLERQMQATAAGQHPLAVILSCIDSRTPAELILDLGLGDIFSIRIAGNVTSPKVIGSMEFGCVVAGAKLIVILGHTSCGAVTAAVKLFGSEVSTEQATGCKHLEPIIQEIQLAIPTSVSSHAPISEVEKAEYVNLISRRNVELCVERILRESPAINQLVKDGRVAVVGAIYNVASGKIDFFPSQIADHGWSEEKENSRHGVV